MMLLKTIGMPTPPSSTGEPPVLLTVKRRTRSPPSTAQVRTILRGVPSGRLEVTSLVKWVASEAVTATGARWKAVERSEEHTSELQSRQYLVCRLLLEK